MVGERIDTSHWGNNLAIFQNFAADQANKADDRIQLTSPANDTHILADRRISIAQGKESLWTRWTRGADESISNNFIRETFKRTIASFFGGDVNKIPPEITKEMKLEKFDDTGRPLTARRVRAVLAALDAYNTKISTMGEAIGENSPCLSPGATPEQAKKLNEMTANLYLGMSDGLKASISNLKENGSSENIKSFIRMLNKEVLERFNEIANVANLNPGELPAGDELYAVKDMLVRTILHENPDVRTAMYSLNKRGYEALITSLEAEKPAEIGRQFAWVEEVSCARSIMQSIHYSFQSEDEILGREFARLPDWTAKLDFATRRLVPYIEHTMIFMPQDSKDNASELLHDLHAKFKELANQAKAGMLTEDMLLSSMIGSYEKISKLNDKLQRNSANRQSRLPMSVIMGSMVDNLFMKPLANKKAVELVSKHGAVLDALDNGSGILKKSLIDRARNCIRQVGVERAEAAVMHFTNAISENIDKFKISDEWKKSHFELMKKQPGCENDKNAKKLCDIFHDSFVQSSISDAMGNINNDDFLTADVAAIIQNAITKKLELLKQENLPSNGLLKMIKPDKMGEYKQLIVDQLNKTYMRGMNLIEGNKASGQYLLKGNPYLPITVREYNYGDVSFNGQLISNNISDKVYEKHLNMKAADGGTLAGQTGMNRDRAAFAEFLETTFPEEKIRHFVSVVLSMSIGVPGVAYTMFHETAEGNEELQNMQKNMLHGYNSMEETYGKGFITMPGDKMQKSNIAIDPDGTIRITTTVVDRTRLSSLKQESFSVPPHFETREITQTVVIPGGQDLSNAVVPSFYVENLSQKMNED